MTPQQRVDEREEARSIETKQPVLWGLKWIGTPILLIAGFLAINYIAGNQWRLIPFARTPGRFHLIIQGEIGHGTPDSSISTTLLATMAGLVLWVGAALYLGGLTRKVRDAYSELVAEIGTRPQLINTARELDARSETDAKIGGVLAISLLLTSVAAALVTAGLANQNLAPSPGWLIALAVLAWLRLSLFIVLTFLILRGGARLLKRLNTDLTDLDKAQELLAAIPSQDDRGFALWRGRTKIGVSLSGGGVRSAAFSLGVLQTLQADPLWMQVRYLSAVSGGSYIAGARQILLTESEDQEILNPFEPGSPEEKYLRTQTHFIAPGILGKTRAVTVWFLGVAIQLATIGTAIFSMAVIAGVVVGSIYLFPQLRESSPQVPATTADMSGILVVTGTLVIAMLPLLFSAFSRGSSKDRRDTLAGLAGILGIIAAAQAVLLILIPLFPEWTSGIGRGIVAALAITAGTGVTAAGILSLASKHIGRVVSAALRITIIAAGTIIPGFAFVIFLGLSYRASEFTISDSLMLLLWTFLALGLLLGINSLGISMHPFYRSRLMTVFALRRVTVKGQSHAEPVPDKEPLKDLRGTLVAGEPELIICAAANVSDRTTPPGRQALSWVFSPTQVGLPNDGFGNRSTLIEREVAKQLPTGDQVIDIPTAVAISGAAFSPAMGKLSRRSLEALLTVFNARLGVWMTNPVMSAKPVSMRHASSMGFFAELFGNHRIHNRRLYVTDGGHWDNLGLVELIRRECEVIMCFDASGEPPDRFNTLGEAIALAATEVGASVDLDPEAMRIQERSAESKGHRRRHLERSHIVGLVRYKSGGVGKIVYCRAALTARTRWAVRSFEERDPRFPSHSTALLFYDDRQFEAYRQLGAEIAADALEEIRADFPECAPQPSTEEWANALVTNVLDGRLHPSSARRFLLKALATEPSFHGSNPAQSDVSDVLGVLRNIEESQHPSSDAIKLATEILEDMVRAGQEERRQWEESRLESEREKKRVFDKLEAAVESAKSSTVRRFVGDFVTDLHDSNFKLEFEDSGDSEVPRLRFGATHDGPLSALNEAQFILVGEGSIETDSTAGTRPHRIMAVSDGSQLDYTMLHIEIADGTRKRLFHADRVKAHDGDS